MRIALLVITLLFASRSAHGATAYEALKTLGKQRGEALLDSVTEVRGDRGKPQPAVWKITVNDPTARSGAMEYGMQGTRQTGRQVPASSSNPSPMNMSQLNLDSDGAHQIAEREAKKAGFIYDYANYLLHAGSRGGAPVWEIRLVDERTGDTGTLTVAATTGNVLSSAGLTNRRRGATVAPAATTPPPALEPEPARPAPQPDYATASQGGGSENPLERFDQDMSQFADRVGYHLSRRSRQIGDTFHNLFHQDKRDTAGPSGSELRRKGMSPPPAVAAPPSAPTGSQTYPASPVRARD